MEQQQKDFLNVMAGSNQFSLGERWALQTKPNVVFLSKFEMSTAPWRGRLTPAERLNPCRPERLLWLSNRTADTAHCHGVLQEMFCSLAFPVWGQSEYWPPHEHTVPEMFTIITPNAQFVSTCSSRSSVKSQTILANRKWSNSLLWKTISAVKTQL